MIAKNRPMQGRGVLANRSGYSGASHTNTKALQEYVLIIYGMQVAMRATQHNKQPKQKGTRRETQREHPERTHKENTRGHRENTQRQHTERTRRQHKERTKETEKEKREKETSKGVPKWTLLECFRNQIGSTLEQSARLCKTSL